jgi:hypothetical protein
MKRIFLFLLLSSSWHLLKAQSNNAPSDYNPHNLKITGYFQFQYQKAQTKGQTSVAGGDFLKDVNERYMVRRGRFKFDRVDEYTNIVFQLDATQDGVSLRDAFIQVKDPKWKTFTLTAGQFTKPFGYILSYSSVNRELPERPRVHQTLLPSERDLGAMLSIQSPKLPMLKYEIGFFNGSGMDAKEYDSKKDLSTSLHYQFNNSNKNWSLGLGTSYYKGYVRSGTTTLFQNGTIASQKGFIANTASENIGTYAPRNYLGFDLQTDFTTAWGKTSIKAEYIKGKQPGLAASASITGPQASKSLGAQATTDLFNRTFNGYFIWMVQEIPHTQLQIIASYDHFDPNTFISGAQIGQAGTNTGAGDIQYNTLGAGLVYYISKQVKFTSYYDHPINEKTSLTGFNSDLRDDVFTLRAQYRF